MIPPRAGSVVGVVATVVDIILMIFFTSEVFFLDCTWESYREIISFLDLPPRVGCFCSFGLEHFFSPGSNSGWWWDRVEVPRFSHLYLLRGSYIYIYTYVYLLLLTSLGSIHLSQLRFRSELVFLGAQNSCTVSWFNVGLQIYLLAKLPIITPT